MADEKNKFLLLEPPKGAPKANFQATFGGARQELKDWQKNRNQFGLSSPYLQGLPDWGIPQRFHSASIPAKADMNQSWKGHAADIPNIFGRTSAVPAKLQLTDATNGILRKKMDKNLSEIASYLIKNHEFIEVKGSLAVFSGRYWILLNDYSEARQMLTKILEQQYGDVVSYLSSKNKEELLKRVIDSPEIMHLKQVPAADFRFICCRDAMYYWPKGEICSPSSHYLRFSHLEVDSLDITPSPTPYFDAFLDNIARGDDALEQLVLEMIGVIVTGYPVKKFFVLEGVGSSGKSQMANFLEDVLGRTSCIAINGVNQLGQRWTPGMLPGKLLCICADVPDKPLKMDVVGTIKELTGEDLIYGERKYQDPFVFQNTAKLLFLTNTPLRILNGVDNAFQRRMVRIPFRYTIPEEKQIPSIHKKLFSEAGGILWKALQALTAFEKRNGIFTHVDVDDSEWSFNQSSLTAQEWVRNFVEDRCILEKSAIIDAQTLYHAFLTFAKQQGYTASIMPPNIFGRNLLASGFPIKSWRNAAMRGYRGIRIADCKDILYT